VIAATIPVTISDEARARVEELGLQREFEMILDHTRQAIPGLRALDVTLQDPTTPGDWPGILLRARRPYEGELDLTGRQWDAWMIQQFPPRVGAQFVLLPVCEGGDER
jgi:hypothetical protein